MAAILERQCEHQPIDKKVSQSLTLWKDILSKEYFDKLSNSQTSD